MRLPPLNSLRAFEAAARHLSFKAAASELNVTAAAISHQIRGLEEDLGISLFERQHQGICLTVAGERYLPGVREAFRGLRLCTEQLKGMDKASVRIGVRHALCQRWLLPRLAEFIQQQPQITLEFELELDRDYLSHDLLLDYRPARANGYRSEFLMGGSLIAVASPALAHTLGEHPDWQQVPLLHDRPNQAVLDYPSWPAWLAEQGVRIDSELSGLVFSTSLMCLDAARAGLGVALAQAELVGEELANGQLVQIGQSQLGRGLNYYLAYPEAALTRPEVRIVCNWLRTLRMSQSAEPFMGE